MERKGDVIHIDFFAGKGECGCPMIRDGYQEPTPTWCECGNYYYKTMFEAVVKHPVQVELLDSCICTGSNSCKRLVHLKPPVITTVTPEEK